MNKIGDAIHEFQTLDAMAREDRFLTRIHPLVKLFLTVLYIALVVSFHKYNWSGLLGMIIYPLLVFEIGGLSFKDALKRLRIVLPLVCIVGIFNPLFDRSVVTVIGGTPVPAGTQGAVVLPGGGAVMGGLAVSGGVVSMMTLMVKAVLTVFASYLLIATTTIEKICYALRKIHVPQMIVIEIMLIDRYVTVLLAEAKRITQAYSLRAPGQKGVAFRAWGPLLGQMLLRSMDRAGEIYESMCIRGFRGEFYMQGTTPEIGKSLVYLAFWTAVFILLRLFPVMNLIGGLFVR